MTSIKLSLRGKLFSLAFAGVIACGLVGAIAHVNVSSLGAAETEVFDGATASLVLIGKANEAVGDVREKQLKLVLAKNPQEAAAEQAQMEQVVSKLTLLLADYEKRIGNDEERGLLATVRSKFAAFKAQADAAAADVKSGDAQRLEAARDNARKLSSKLFDDLGESIDQLAGFNQKVAEGTHAKAQATLRTASITLAVSTIIAASALFALAMWVTQGLVRQIGGEPADVVDLARAVAQGDLSTRIAIKSGDRTSVVAQLGSMQHSLAAMVSGVRANADGLATASAQIAQGNLDLSNRTEQQAGALEETAASMEQLSSTVKQNAENARQANQLAMGASVVATQGGKVVAQVVETMRGINDSSKKIADIISVIDGIAFQTNILALNAAVEAARAGEQGRGFAVVASEVRSLAGRSAEAAKEIKSLIGASVERVDQGTLLVDQAGQTMTEVVSSVKRVTDIMGEISAASSEQSAGVAQVGEAVTQMDRTTQQNAALVEQSAAAAASLKAQAQQLVQTVAVFKLA
ncbi:MAG TPA: methyl-accepting chemotaxis protein [Rhizobacter sp.]|nr:methyl-accepting chemotaxis protein [Rhizobacter sp.]